MTAIKAPLVSTFARFVQGDIKGGVAAHAFRIETIRAAVEQMFKGNYSPITEAAALTEGKAKKARAYHAGFATFGVIGTDVKKVDYKGALNSADNKLARDQIASLTEVHTNAFFAAFDAVMAEKAAPKAKTEPAAAPAPATTDDATTADDDRSAADGLHIQAVSIDAAVNGMVNLLAGDMLTGAQLEELIAAVQAAEARALLALPELLAA